MSEIPLPSGGVVVLRDPKTLRSREKRLIDLAFADAGIGERPNASAGLVGRHELAKYMIVSWVLPYKPGAPVPSEDPDALDDLEIPDYDAIVTAVMPSLLLLYGNRAKTPDDSGTPGSPTAPSGD